MKVWLPSQGEFEVYWYMTGGQPLGVEKIHETWTTQEIGKRTGFGPTKDWPVADYRKVNPPRDR